METSCETNIKNGINSRLFCSVTFAKLLIPDAIPINTEIQIPYAMNPNAKPVFSPENHSINCQPFQDLHGPRAFAFKAADHSLAVLL